MVETPRSHRVIPRGRPFEKGNPGRPKGARHKATMAAQMLLDGQAKALTQKAIDQAKSEGLESRIEGLSRGLTVYGKGVPCRP